MSQGQPTSTTRRSFLGAATVATAATAATLTTSPIAQGEQADKIRVAQTPTEAKPTPPAATIAKEGDWSKPSAMAIPKGEYFKLEQGRYGAIFPRTPANYGFSILAKVKPGREKAIREYGKTIEEAVEDAPDRSCAAETSLSALGVVRNQRGLVLHVSGHLRHRLRQISRGCRCALHIDRDHDRVVNLEGFPEDWKTNVPAVIKFFREPKAQLSGIWGILM